MTLRVPKTALREVTTLVGLREKKYLSTRKHFSAKN